MKNIIDEVKRYWNKSPFWAKVVWIISVFFSFSSIASLSDVIFDWKKFILEGIEFYRLIVAHFGRFIEFTFDIKLSPSELDWLVLIGILITIYRRYIAYFWLSPPDKEPLSRGWVIGVIVWTIFWWVVKMGVLLAALSDKLNLFVLVFCYFCLAFIIAYPFFVFPNSKLSKDDRVNQTIGAIPLKRFYKNKTRLFIIYYGPLLTSIALLLILAAINSGLTR